ncbi:uncharacterized protein LOC132725499 [Ruditapes philippinarum]|uniref:uncharacterized protein LOC132725499 n=1 Tax=Ruditapes philippinarum TaxID=129788 RepID=UPI00295B5BC8|nr:uncharacterized protein LOC132725499 [Ruditapes philippinarum]
MMPKKIVRVLVILFYIIGLISCFDCTGKPNGVYESSCQSAIFCTDNTTRKLDCTIPKVVNEETGECDNALNVHTPCGTFRDCSVRDDGGYPDLETNCQWYYMCSYGILYGHHKCANGLVWNTVLQTCDFPLDVLPPCGRKH